MARSLFIMLGCVSTVLAALGAVLPVLPTVPFLILAAWAFAKSSPTLHHRLRNHRHFGPPLRDWEENGAIPLRAKVAAAATMTISLVVMLATVKKPWVVGFAVLVMACSAAFILTRPSAGRVLAEPEPEDEADRADRRDPGRPEADEPG